MQNKQNKQNKNENGRSMIEMLGVLAIIGVLSVGGIAGYSKAMYRYRLNKTIEEITQIAGNVRSFFAPQKSYDGLDLRNNVDLLKKAQLVPEEMWSGNSLYNPFGSLFYISAEAKIYSSACRSDSLCSKQAFNMWFNNTSEDVCIDLITHDWSNVGVSLILMFNNKNSIFPNTNIWIAPPIDVNQAVKLCEVPIDDANGVDTISFYFDMDIKGSMANYVAYTINTLNSN